MKNITYSCLSLFLCACGAQEEKETQRVYDEIPQPTVISYEDMQTVLKDDSTWSMLDNSAGEPMGRQKVLGDIRYKEARMSILLSQRFVNGDTALQVIPLSAQGIAKSYDIPLNSRLYAPEDTVLYFTEGCFHFQQRKSVDEEKTAASWKKICLE